MEMADKAGGASKRSRKNIGEYLRPVGPAKFSWGVAEVSRERFGYGARDAWFTVRPAAHRSVGVGWDCAAKLIVGAKGLDLARRLEVEAVLRCLRKTAGNCMALPGS